MIRGMMVLAGVLLLAGCAEEDVKTYTVEKAPPTEAHAHASGELLWETPDGWTASEGSSMRLASFSVPGPEGVNSGDCSIIVLGGDGGGLVPNVNRWRGQIGLAGASEEAILSASREETGGLGEYRIFRLVNPDNADAAFLVAMIPGGARTLFVKLAGPVGLVDSADDAFVGLCRSLRESDS
ncbi:MAG: hypothetical protein QF819_01635 [Gemmatimonadota bacterium]|nr:hypothetical protein [Gemmatimonadota bacterium]